MSHWSLIGGIGVIVLTGTLLYALQRRLASPRRHGAVGETRHIFAPAIKVRIRNRDFLPFPRNARTQSVLSIYGSDICFRVLNEARWSFADLESVDVQETATGANLIFERREPRCALIAEVSGIAEARRVLSALPPAVRLARNALVLLRGSAASAGAPTSSWCEPTL